ncbi:MAG: hypothetical protein ACOY4P_00065 [Pseudomonadota bacterium]|jgi:hypothetical protein
MAKSSDLQAIKQERAKLETMLAAIVQREKDAEAAQRDAGRPVLLAALDRIKIGAMERPDAKAIAAAIAKHGGARVAASLAGLAAD